MRTYYITALLVTCTLKFPRECQSLSFLWHGDASCIKDAILLNKLFIYYKKNKAIYVCTELKSNLNNKLKCSISSEVYNAIKKIPEEYQR